LTIGVLPNGNLEGMSDAVDLPIITDLGNARNNINVLSSDVAIACGMGLGTASEVALALKNGKKVILLTDNQKSQSFFSELSPNHILIANNPEMVIQQVKQILNLRNPINS
jgi:uncharacterized protein (TIGR00725 family)